MRLSPSICMAAAVLAVVPGLRGQEASSDDRGFSVPAAISRRISSEYRQLDDRRRQLAAELSELPMTPKDEQSARVGWRVFGFGDALPVRQWVEIDLGVSQRIDAVSLIPVDAPTNSNSEPGIGFPRRFRVELEDDGGSLVVIADFTAEDFPNPGVLPVFLPAGGTMARRIRVSMSRPWAKNLRFSYALGEVMVLQGNRNLATGLTSVSVRTSGSLESPPAWSRDNLIDGKSTVGAPLLRSGGALAHGWESARFSSPAASTWVQIDLGDVRSFDEVRLVPARLPHHAAHHGYGFPRNLRLEVATDAAFDTSRVLLDWAAELLDSPTFTPLTVPGDGMPARYLRVTARDLWQRAEKTFIFALGELQVYQGDINVAAGAAVTAENASSEASYNFDETFLTDGVRGSLRFIEWPEWLASLSRRREILHELEGTHAGLAVIHPALVRTATWTLSGALALVILGILAVIHRARRAQVRAVAALQRRIAGDLHDEIGSNLASIAMLSELGQRQPTGLAANDVEEIRRLATESATAMRDLVWLIQPGPHDAARLTDRLRAAARRLLDGLAWTFDISGLDTAPSLDVQRHLLLALKEILHNVLRHAGARHVEIRLVVQGGRFVLAVSDDGRGFDPSHQGDGHGFTSLRHRAELLQGELTIESHPGRGTRVALDGALRSSTKDPVPSS